jgi:hypothetical protein
MFSRTAMFTIIVWMVLHAIPVTHAQDENSAPNPSAIKEEAKSVAKSTQRQATAYRFDFSIDELEDGKKLNTRKYSMNLSDYSGGGGQDLKIGTRVPIRSDDGKFQYLDIGTSIRARLPPSTPATLDVTAEMTGFASPEEATKGDHPLLRQMRISGSTTLILNKPMIIGSVADPNSKREFELEVTATKLQ